MMVARGGRRCCKGAKVDEGVFTRLSFFHIFVNNVVSEQLGAEVVVCRVSCVVCRVSFVVSCVMSCVVPCRVVCEFIKNTSCEQATSFLH